ncbi:MAG: acetyl-CoA hydrolase/transferase C-terminal domain-containing protein [Deltaproteobacteria bacterium]|nr:acetyl-CoA hydrolase/transferase C-terminal domain-containing protein [Deltaproteobacteria bacterium]
MKQLESNWRARAVSPDEVVSHIRSGDRVFLHAAAATPTALMVAMCDRADLTDVRAYHLHTAGPAPFAEPPVSDRVRSVSLFTGPAMRKAVAAGRADFIPVFLSAIPGLFTQRVIPLEVAIVQVSPPDRHGLCTLGTSCDAARAAVDSAKTVLAVINEQMPRTHGHTTVALDRITAFSLADQPLYESASGVIDPVEARIGELIAGLIDDGATLQMGIGAIPDAVLANLGDKHDLGVHTEMFSDGLLPLIEGGVVTNRRKEVHTGRTTTSFVWGSRKLYDFVDDNPRVEFHPCDRTNDTALIRRNPAVIAINSALQVDLTGQVCADSLGHQIYSGIGGQMDFIHGASLSKGGKPIIALPSTAKANTVSRITMALTEGAGVVTTRGHVHWMVTEYGVVNLHGKTLRERGELLTSIAHPDFREELRKTLAQVRHF